MNTVLARQVACWPVGILLACRPLRGATRVAHCRPPGPPASLSLWVGQQGATLLLTGLSQPAVTVLK